MSRVLPILFNTDMVRAILDGRKTVTRRVAKGIVQFDEKGEYFNVFRKEEWIGPICKEWIIKRYAPYQLGDILYVRETWGTYTRNWWEADYFMYRSDYLDNATTYEVDGYICDLPKWRPSIHMPNEAARIWLKVTDVRVERLQDITEKEAEKEGAKAYGLPNCSGTSARIAFAEIWDGTVKQKEYEWPSNPWVWVIEFERCEKPEGV